MGDKIIKGALFHPEEKRLKEIKAAEIKKRLKALKSHPDELESWKEIEF